LHAGIQQYLRADLADGHRTGRFTHGDDPITVDLVSGTLMATIRRLISRDAPLDDADQDAIPAVVARLLGAIGVDSDEARSLASAAQTERTTSASTRQRDRLTTTGGPTKHP
jgi:hypothetical protein